MKTLIVLAAMICLGLSAGVTPALAQHGSGGAGGGMGRGGGMGQGGGMGTGGGMGAGASNMPGGRDMGQPDANGNANGNSHGPGYMAAPGPKSPIDMLANNSKLNMALTSSLSKNGVLPAGANLADECKGFKNLGQCVAGLHVSHNLGNVNFYCLRQAMTSALPPSGSASTCSTTGKLSLGKAIHTLSPNANAKSEAKQATDQANTDIQSASL